MTFVASFKNVTPSPRYDDEPWTQVRIEEALATEGPWTPVEVQALTELDTDPEEPQARNITTTEATLEAGFFRLTFLDAGGAADAPQILEWPPAALSSNPVPTLDELRMRSKLLAKRYPAPSGNPLLQQLLFDALPLLSNLTGRNIGMTGEGSEQALQEELAEGWSWDPWESFFGYGPGGDGATGGSENWLARLAPVPGRLVGVAKRAVTLKCERLAVGGGIRQRVEAHNKGLLRTMSAGPYSEGRITAGDVRKLMMLDPDPQLDEALRLLITEDAWGVFLYQTTGQQLPGTALTAIDGLKVPGSYESLLTDNWFSSY